MSKQSLCLGKAGEATALNFLKTKGYRILARNYKTKLGEIDIIAVDKDTVCFVEVKTRTSKRFGLPEEAVCLFKQKQIAKAALSFLKQNKLLHKKARFDVVSIIGASQSEAAQIDLIQNAFELDDSYVY